MKYLSVLLVFLTVGTIEISAQMTHNMPQPVMSTDCDDSDDCDPEESNNCCGFGIPPPPGLPIDFGISVLIAAGLGLGIHHIRNRK